MEQIAGIRNEILSAEPVNYIAKPVKKKYIYKLFWIKKPVVSSNHLSKLYHSLPAPPKSIQTVLAVDWNVYVKSPRSSSITYSSSVCSCLWCSYSRTANLTQTRSTISLVSKTYSSLTEPDSISTLKTRQNHSVSNN